MKTTKTNEMLDRLLAPLHECLTPESAQRLLTLKADPKLQAHVQDLAEKSNRGTLSAAERAEYECYVSFGTFIALLKSKIRRRLRQAEGAHKVAVHKLHDITIKAKAGVE